MNIDIDRLRIDIKNYYLSAYFTLGLIVALGYCINIDNLTNEEVVDLAINLGFNLYDYEIRTR
ncbi:unknown [Clostridium sp. CAG:609]|nr:unknown [Clostridium sp. CAG:609]